MYAGLKDVDPLTWSNLTVYFSASTSADTNDNFSVWFLVVARWSTWFLFSMVIFFSVLVICKSCWPSLRWRTLNWSSRQSNRMPWTFLVSSWDFLFSSYDTFIMFIRFISMTSLIDFEEPLPDPLFDIIGVPLIRLAWYPWSMNHLGGLIFRCPALKAI